MEPAVPLPSRFRPQLLATTAVVAAGLLGTDLSARAADVGLPPPAATGFLAAWSMLVDVDARFTSWSGNRGFPGGYALGTPGRGSQFYMPLAVQIVGRPSPDYKVELMARTGWVHARQDSGGGLAGSVSALTDTVVSGTFTYLATPGWQPFISINANLPTGSANLPGTRAFTRMDPDLVEVPSYGEGFNLGATAGVNIPVGESTLITASLSHTHRGAYTRDPVTSFGDPDNRLQPGASSSGSLQVAHMLGAMLLKASATYIVNQGTRIDGAFINRMGATLALAASAGYTWSPEHNTTLSASFSRTNPNLVFDPAIPAAVREAFNSNSNALRLRLDHSYRLTEQWTLGAFASWFNRDANAYIPTAGSFSPAKTKIALGGSARYQMTQNAAVTVRAEHFWVSQGSRPDVVVPIFGPFPGTAVPPLAYTGWTVSLGGTITY
jgi:hypothetical protein